MACARVSGGTAPAATLAQVFWKAKDRGLWLTLAALTVLLVVLAALQYRWTSEIGRAEAERRQTQLERSAWRFANGFDREMGRLLAAFFRMEPLPPDGDPRAQLLERLAAWRRDEHTALLSTVLLATRSPSGAVTLEACGDRRRGVPRGPVDEGARAAAPEAPVDGGSDGTGSSSGRGRSRSPAGPLVPARGRRVRRAPLRAVGTLPRHRHGAACSWTRTTSAASSSPSSRRRTSAPSPRASSS